MATIPGTDQSDSLLGGVEDDLLQGLEGADTLDGADGIDTLEGGIDDDTYVVGTTYREVDGITDHWEDVVVEGADAGIDTVIWTGVGRYVLGANIENAIAGAFWSGTLEGNELDNDLTGWEDEGNYLFGGTGADTLRGGGWDDNLYGDAGNDLLIGQNDPLVLEGTIDGDELDGGEGADTMIGGDGYDVYWADDLGDVLVEDAPPAGLDEIGAYYYLQDSVYWAGAGVYTLAYNVEYLHLRGGATEGLGNEQANVLWSDYGSYDQFGNPIGDAPVTLDGAGGDDILLGGSGADDLSGGEGSDRIEGSTNEDTLRGGAGDDDLHGDSTSIFAPSNDTLFGEEGDDLLNGGFGDDSLDGGDGIDVFIGDYGDDTMTGGAGADRFGGMPGNEVVTDFTDGEDLILGDIGLFTITQDGADTLITYEGDFGWDDGTIRLIGIDSTLITAEDFLSPISGDEFDNNINGNGEAEFISAGEGDDQVDAGGGDDGAVGGVGEDTMSGGNGADTLNGGLGDDTIDGGAGQDQLSGGSGNDSYFISLGGDTVHEDAKGGVDTVESNADHRLGDNVENLFLGDSASAAALASFAQALPALGGSGAERLDGIGNALANKIVGSSGANLVSGLDGNDRLLANGGDDIAKGGKGNDQLKGGAGDDLLSGDAGNDKLSGGAGADVFSFAGASGRDRIADFSKADGDLIRINSSAATRFADLAISSNGEGGSFVAWAGNRIEVVGMAPGALRAKHFEFVQQAGAAPMSAFGEDAEQAAPGWRFDAGMTALDGQNAIV